MAIPKEYPRKPPYLCDIHSRLWDRHHGNDYGNHRGPWPGGGAFGPHWRDIETNREWNEKNTVMMLIIRQACRDYCHGEKDIAGILDLTNPT